MVSEAHDKLELELRRGVVVLAVLSRLRTLRYGYELRQSLIAAGLPIEEGTLYPLLRRLESQGVLTSEWRGAQGPARRYYVLSDAGRDLLARLTSTWHGITKAMDDILDEEQGDDS